MDVEFADKQRLALIETERAAETKLSVALIKACRKKLEIIRAAPDERTLRNWKSLHYEKLEGERSGEHSIRLNDQWRLILKVDGQCKPPKATIIGIEDYH